MGGRLAGKKKWIAGAGAVVVVAGAVGGWALARPDGSAATTTTITATATVGTIRQTVTTTGTLAPAQRADLSFQVSGTVTSVPVTVGDKVAKGATLATVDDTELRAAVDSAQAGVDAAVEQVNSASGSTVAQVASADAQLAAARSTLARAKASLAEATLRSPIPGTVASVVIATGDTVGSGGGTGGSGGSGGGTGGTGGTGTGGTGTTGTAQVVVISTKAWVVNASVGAPDLASVKKGLQVEITPDGSNQKVFGTVRSVGVMASTGSSGSATFPVTIGVTGTPKGLYAGGTVTAVIVVKQVDNVLTIPSAAISSTGNTTYVTLTKGGRQTRKTVVVGAVYGAQTQITSGIAEGDQVVVRQIQLPQGGGGTGTNRQRGTGGQFPGGGFGGGQFPDGGQFPGGGQAPGGGQFPGGGQAPGGGQ